MKAPYMTDKENLFRGRWRVVEFYTYDPEQGWGNPKRYPPKGLIWKFITQCQVRYPVGGKQLAHKGKLRKYRIRRVTEIETFEYAYFPALRKLCFNPCPDAPDGYMNRYRVEKAAENEYWLYDLECEQEHYKGQLLRLRFKKYKL